MSTDFSFAVVVTWMILVLLLLWGVIIGTAWEVWSLV